MNSFRPLSLAEQAAGHIRTEILEGRLSGLAPGVHKLAADLGIHHVTVEQALKILEKEEILIPRGPGRRRLILASENSTPSSMRIGILPYENTDRSVHFLLAIQHKLQNAGHSAGFATKSLQDMGMNAKRVAAYVKSCDVDAWIIIAGPREVLEWFADQPAPAFSIFGNRRNIPIASTGPDKLPALLASLDRLVALGHQRIVMLLREEHRIPRPGFVAQAFLNALEAHSLPTGPYNLPDWKNDAVDFRRCLDSLFRITPPTALIVDESFLFTVARQHLANMGIFAPRYISLICADPDPTFEWFSPSIAHIHWDSRIVVQRVVRWANNVARGNEDQRQSLIKAKFIEGGTIGPARQGID